MSVENGRTELAHLYDFEPYAAFCRLDKDKKQKIYVMDVFNFMQENNRFNFSVKDVQLMLDYYDLDNSGSLEYPEFMKFVLPCNNPALREDVCQRKTFEVDAHNGKRMHETVETSLADFFEREMNFHIKNEMLKNQLVRLPDWNVRAAFNLLDSQKQGFVSHFNLYGFLMQNKFDASDDELIAIIRRIEGAGDGKVAFDELKYAMEPKVIKLVMVQFAEDEKEYMASNNPIKNGEMARKEQFMKTYAGAAPIHMNNSVE